MLVCSGVDDREMAHSPRPQSLHGGQHLALDFAPISGRVDELALHGGHDELLGLNVDVGREILDADLSVRLRDHDETLLEQPQNLVHVAEVGHELGEANPRWHPGLHSGVTKGTPDALTAVEALQCEHVALDGLPQDRLVVIHDGLHLLLRAGADNGVGGVGLMQMESKSRSGALPIGPMLNDQGMQQLDGGPLTLARHGDEQAIASQVRRLHWLHEVEPPVDDVLDGLLRVGGDLVELALRHDGVPRRSERALGRCCEQIQYLLKRSREAIHHCPRVPATGQEELMEARVHRCRLDPTAVEALPDVDGQCGQRQGNHLSARGGLLVVQHFLLDVRENKGQLAMLLVHLGHQGRQRRCALVLEVANLVDEEHHCAGLAVQAQERPAKTEAIVEAEVLRHVPLHTAAGHQHVPEGIVILPLATWAPQRSQEVLLACTTTVERQIERLHILPEPRNQPPSAVHQHSRLPDALHARTAKQRELAVLAHVGLRPDALDVLHNKVACLLPMLRRLVVALRELWRLVLA